MDRQTFYSIDAFDMRVLVVAKSNYASPQRRMSFLKYDANFVLKN